ncbi:hypothetical protein L208DRAFT_1281361 [Tricholoma matsutake]|nr:hypothetical protein L208DRAFT_1281361 [Tricholoma matsutake 945]
MTARDSVVSAHDHQFSQPPQLPRRRRTHSTASTRSTPSSKRSPSPIVTFSATPLSSDPKGVKNITRKVIRTLEGLGHLDSTDMGELDDNYDSEQYDQREVEAVLTVNGAAKRGETPDAPVVVVMNGRLNNSVAGKPVTLKPVEKIDWEIPRKVLHSSIGFFTLYLYVHNGDVKIVVFLLWTALAFLVPIDILRLRYPAFERTFERCVGFLMRESEKKSTNGILWYILGVNFVLTFYPIDVATISILILSWADTAASTVGRLFGAKTPRLPSRLPFLRLPLAPRKSLAGFIAATVTGTLIAVGFWGWVAPFRSGTPGLSWVWDSGASLASSSSVTGRWVGLGGLGVVAGLISGVAEALDLGSLDDNLTLPIISGGCILGFLKLLGLFSASPSS